MNKNWTGLNDEEKKYCVPSLRYANDFHIISNGTWLSLISHNVSFPDSSCFFHMILFQEESWNRDLNRLPVENAACNKATSCREDDLLPVVWPRDTRLQASQHKLGFFLIRSKHAYRDEDRFHNYWVIKKNANTIWKSSNKSDLISRQFHQFILIFSLFRRSGLTIRFEHLISHLVCLFVFFHDQPAENVLAQGMNSPLDK